LQILYDLETCDYVMITGPLG